jgi:arginase family enzyme
MQSPDIRILDFDSSVTKQQNLLNKYPHQVINLKDLTSKSRLWMDSRTRNAISERVAKSSRDCVTFLGSGDFHNITPILLEQFQEPISLIVFDFHPDWDILPPRFGCGSWVKEALRRKNIQKCLLIGVSSDDISSFWIQSADLGALDNDRLEIYPYAHIPSRVFCRKVPENISLKTRREFLGARIYWEELKNKNLKDFFSSIINRLNVKDAYVSIDKDCLNNKSALTNWEEGKLAIEQLLLMLRLIKENLNIAGMDITGDYSRVRFSGKIKGIFSRLDHPREVQADKIPEEEITRINEFTNMKILETIFA